MQTNKIKNLSFHHNHSDENPSVIHSSIKIMRNLKKYSFLSTLSDSKQINLEEEIIKEVKHWDNPFSLHEIEGLTINEMNYYRENNLISEDLFHKKRGKFLVSKKEQESISIILNSVDHLNFIINCPELYTMDTYKKLENIEEKIGEKFKYAASTRFGFLTAYVKNCGLGMQISVLVHLSGLTLKNRIKEIKELFNKRGYKISPWLSKKEEKENDINSYYRVTSYLNFGISETDLIKRFHDGIKNLMELNREALLEYYNAKKISFIDSIYRSIGLLKYARQMSYKEAFHHISNLRMGLEIDEDFPVKIQTLNEIFKKVKDGYVSRISEENNISKNVTRANIIKELLNQ